MGRRLGRATEVAGRLVVVSLLLDLLPFSFFAPCSQSNGRFMPDQRKERPVVLAA
jgi:hypothetical protein